MQGTGWLNARLSFRLSIMIAVDLIVGTLRSLPAENDGYSSELRVRFAVQCERKRRPTDIIASTTAALPQRLPVAHNACNTIIETCVDRSGP